MYGEGGLPENGRLLHTALLGVSTNDVHKQAKRRRASMCLDGTPVVYSLKSERNTTVLPFRMLVEPGGLGITVPEQINTSFNTVTRLLHNFGWTSALDSLNAVVSRVFPWGDNTTEKLWGGIWLGCDLSGDESQLRLYLNLRYGESLSRWQRVADVLSWFGDSTLAGPLKTLIDQVSPHAIPVGLGIAVSEQIRALRLYVGMYDPGYESILKAGMNKFYVAKRDVEFLCSSFTDTFGPFIRQSVTLGYDFILDNGRLTKPKIKRTKIDISCQLIKQDRLHLLVPVIIDLTRAWKLDDKQLHIFLEDMTECFGGFDIEFMSCGFVEGLEHVTVYAKPHGFKQE